MLCAMLFFASTGCDRGSHPFQTGKPAPDFNISDGSTSIHLADYRGKIVLLNFWASWCEPCTLELPSMLDFHRQHPEYPILAVSIDEDDQAYKSFLINHRVDLITVRDPKQTVATMFSTEQWPETYIIDRQGRIRRRFIGATDWNSPEILQFIKTL